MSDVSESEIDRQYRVLRQTLGMHAMLRDHYAYWDRIAQVVLLLCSVVFCATVFADDRLYAWFEVAPDDGRVILGITSITAFAASLALLLADWRRLSTRHRDAADKWSEVLRLFREARNDDGTWPSEQTDELNRVYWETDRNTVEIPEGRFNRLKARYLLKCEISKAKSENPGCPRLVLWLVLRLIDTAKAITSAISKRNS